MASAKVLLCLGFFLAILILATIHEIEAKGSRRSLSSRKSSSRSIYRKSSSNHVKASNSKPKPKTFHSSVTRSQIQGKKPFNKRFSYYAATGLLIYGLATSPVYSGQYRPYYESSNIVIPKHRAIRIANETYKVVTKNNLNCTDGNLTKYAEDKVINVTTKVSYEKPVKESIKMISPLTITDPKRTNLTLSANATNGYITKIEIRIDFNQSILTNATSNTTDLTNCTIMQYESYAYVVAIESFSSRNEANFVFCQFALFLGIIVLSL